MKTGALEWGSVTSILKFRFEVINCTVDPTLLSCVQGWWGRPKERQFWEVKWYLRCAGLVTPILGSSVEPTSMSKVKKKWH